ncbi:hypothetical protein MHTCC0001_28750 [Flavobacteriaceae bacterium MHTCC 0001]
MKRAYLILLLILVFGCKTDKNKKDPNEKNWYVFKHKTRNTCPDVHWGKKISGANQYDLICGPLIKKKADSCWSKNCDLEKRTVVSDSNCPSLLYSDEFKAVFERESSCGSLNDIHIVYRYNGTCTNTKAMVNMSKYIVKDTLEPCSEDQSRMVFHYEKKQN